MMKHKLVKFKMLKVQLLQISLGKLIWEVGVIGVEVVVEVGVKALVLEALSLDVGSAVLQVAAAAAVL